MTLPEQIALLRRTLHRLLADRLSEQTSRPVMQLLTLKVVAQGGHGQAYVAERLMVDPPAMSRLVDRLEEDGLVTRQAGENRRCVRLEITPAGLKELEVLRAVLRELEAEMGQHLSGGEMTELKRLLEKVQGALGPPLEPETPCGDGSKKA
ncbi:MAG TPA: MarR family transcriptional regulator [Myxococcus sp.]|jgi:DNA-binding MarR family transcriptional regulator|nr:MarR family transcriptional regulator [Myxococcus sp.]